MTSTNPGKAYLRFAGAINFSYQPDKNIQLYSMMHSF
jgi:hypothetical protein